MSSEAGLETSSARVMGSQFGDSQQQLQGQPQQEAGMAPNPQIAEHAMDMHAGCLKIRQGERR